MNKLSLTIGIPTYYGGPGLIDAVKSILDSKEITEFILIVSVDGNPLEKRISQVLKNLGVVVIENKERGGQVARIKQIISMTQTDILILTQDDIHFKPNTVSKIVNEFINDSDVTMISAKLLPHKSTTFFESILEVGIRMNHKIGYSWNGGDNYLLSTGRCLAFRTAFIKKLNISEEVINSDAYLYFANKNAGGKFASLKDAVVFNKSPQNLKEHLKQSRKFQFSFEELTRYFGADIKDEYKIPNSLVINSLFSEFLSKPIHTVLYVATSLYVRTKGKNMYSKAKRFWDTDKSTK